jgi:hypothetical protein
LRRRIGICASFHRGDAHQRPVLFTLRFSLDCFSVVESAFDSVQAILIRVNLPAGRTLIFDDWQIE